MLKYFLAISLTVAVFIFAIFMVFVQMIVTAIVGEVALLILILIGVSIFIYMAILPRIMKEDE